MHNVQGLKLIIHLEYLGYLKMHHANELGLETSNRTLRITPHFKSLNCPKTLTLETLLVHV